MFLWISQNSLESTSARASFLIKMQAETWNFIKTEALGQVFSCEFWEIFKNTFFTRHLRSTAIAFFVWYRQTSVSFFVLYLFAMLCAIWYHSYDSKNVWRSVNLQVSTSPLKVTLLHGCFSHFLNCANGTKLRKASHFFIPTW